MLRDELWVKTRERHFVLYVEGVEQVGDDFFGKFQAVGIADPLEDLLIFFRRGRIDLQLVMDAAELRGIHELFGGKIGGEYDELVEQKREFFTRMEGKIVALTLERKNPSV